MRIDPGSSKISPASGRKPGRASSRASSSSEATSAESPASADIAPFMSNLDEVIEVRTELVEEVRERLNRGEFLSRDAAEKTAAAILADLASFMGQ